MMNISEKLEQRCIVQIVLLFALLGIMSWDVNGFNANSFLKTSFLHQTEQRQQQKQKQIQKQQQKQQHRRQQELNPCLEERQCSEELSVLRAVVNGASEDDMNAPAPTGSSSFSSSPHNIIPLASTGKSQLVSAFAALDETDQYDSVLTGLCAKMLDSDVALEDQIILEDPIQLLQEMNDRRIEASPRSLMALIDASVKTQDAQSMSQVLSLCSRNSNGITQYGILQNTVTQIPAATTATQPSFMGGGSSQPKVLCPDGTRKTRQERLDSVADVPVDNRSTEVTSALAIIAVFGIGFSADLFGMDDITPWTNTILFLLTVVGVVDNFYDVLQFGTKFVSGFVDSQLQSNDGKKNSSSSSSTNGGKKVELNLPDKDSLPFGLGEGKVTGTVVRGFTRLLSSDTERECECEAAALYAAYTLGLPCFAFRPNSLEAACLMVESIQGQASTSSRKQQNMDPLLSNFGILKIMIWLMSPVAMESMKHPQLINSDPREADGFLQRLIERKDQFFTTTQANGSRSSNSVDDVSWLLEDYDEKECKDLIKWAYAEADVLLRRNMDDVQKVSQQLSSGAATIGDCVATIEKWY